MRLVTVAVLAALLFPAGAAASSRVDPPASVEAQTAATEATPPAGQEVSEETPTEESSFWQKLRDEEDGAFDIGGWLGSGKGFLPVALPVSEPAVGIGLAGAIAYFHSQEGDAPESGSAPPSISFLGGVWTDNDTRAGALGHLGVWRQGRIRYTGVVLDGDVNLEFFEQGARRGEGLSWNIQLSGTFHQLKVAVRERLFLGVKYYFFSTESVIGDQMPTDEEASDLVSDLAGFGLTATYDGRNTTFSPTAGLFADLSLTLHDEVLGSDFNYSRLDFRAYKYWDLDHIVLGLRSEGSGVGSGGPFYGFPYLRMRGVPAFRYVGKYTALAEIESMWRVTPRWGWLGFVAAGQSVAGTSDFGSGEVVVAGGTGFRYLLARELGLAVGIDVAGSGEDTAVYFVIGTYWGGR